VFTAAAQWFERTLDDSANKRLSVPQMFLGTDAALRIAINVTSGLVVYPAVIRRRIEEELPFIASENILMRAVRKGGDRQTLHEEIRRLSQEAGTRVKQEGAKNDLIERIRNSGRFGLDDEELIGLLNPELYTGRSAEQVEEFIAAEVDPVIEKELECPVMRVELNV
jgi:adenylosuccinate lyase